MISIYVTCKDKEEAEKISKILLEKRLIACSNIFPIDSMYWWNNKINKDKEYVMILKTKKSKFNEIKKVIKKKSSYEVPCICVWNIENINEKYKVYINKEVK